MQETRTGLKRRGKKNIYMAEDIRESLIGLVRATEFTAKITFCL